MGQRLVVIEDALVAEQVEHLALIDDGVRRVCLQAGDELGDALLGAGVEEALHLIVPRRDRAEVVGVGKGRAEDRRRRGVVDARAHGLHEFEQICLDDHGAVDGVVVPLPADEHGAVVIGLPAERVAGFKREAAQAGEADNGGVAIRPCRCGEQARVGERQQQKKDADGRVEGEELATAGERAADQLAKGDEEKDFRRVPRGE